VIIPTYDYAGYLGGAMASVLGQTHDDLELIVLDNASTDDTPVVVARVCDSRLRSVRNATNIGFNANVNLGFGLARGDVVVIMGADDEWSPTFLERAVARLDDDATLAFVHGRAVWIDAEGTAFGDSHAGWAHRTSGDLAFVDCFRRGFSLTTMVMRTDAVRRVGGFHREWDEIADAWLFLLLCFEGAVGYLDEPLVRYRVHERSMTTSWSRGGEGFRGYIALAEAAFDLADARARRLTKWKRFAVRSVVRDTIAMLHVVRQQDGVAKYLSAFGTVVAITPEVCLLPTTWARFTLGLVPPRVVLALRQWKRRRWGRRHGLASAGPAR